MNTDPPRDRCDAPAGPRSIFPLDHRVPLQDSELHIEDLCKALTTFATGLHSDYDRFLLAERLGMAVCPTLCFSEHDRAWLGDEGFFRHYRRFMDSHNWHSADRKYVLFQFASWASRLPGHFAECGVYKGGSAVYLCEVADNAAKHVHLFDSFQGLPEPSRVDGVFWTKGNLAAPLDEVNAALSAYTCFSCYPGWIPSTFSPVSGQRFCLVHIDVDLYQATRDSLLFFGPRLVPGGVIILDDHGFTTCPGATKAADEYCDAIGTRVINLPTGQGLILNTPSI